MFAGEATIFLIILLTGAFVILRTLRREVRLMERESNFLSAVTHELKSPIASIRLYVETMEMRELAKEERDRFLSSIRQDLNRLETLVSNVLAAARLDASTSAVAYETADLARDAEDLLNSWINEVEHKGVKVAFDISPDSIPVRYDLQSLETIMRNLLDNAVKYSGEAKEIQVQVSADNDSASIVVRDGGIGLERKELAQVFDKFYRVGNEMVRNTRGTGLGLYLVQRLARDLGGDVTVNSGGLGKGSAFTVKLPLDREATA
jgi:signal transduction histidine kinase